MHVADVDVGESLRDLGRAVGRHLVDDDDFIDVSARVHEARFEPRLLVEHDDVE
jgi:hypothetical protein